MMEPQLSWHFCILSCLEHSHGLSQGATMVQRNLRKSTGYAPWGCFGTGSDLSGDSWTCMISLPFKAISTGRHLIVHHICAGVSFGGLGGYKGTAMVPEGGDFIFSQALSPQSGIARLPGGADSMLRVNSFDIKYREDGSTEQFLSDLSVYDWQGVERLRKTISVNDPLRYKVCYLKPITLHRKCHLQPVSGCVPFVRCVLGIGHSRCF